MPSLTDYLANADPTTAAVLQGSTAASGLETAQDPSRWRDLGPGGALAHMLAGVVYPSQMTGAANQIAAQRGAAMPAYLNAMSSANPAAAAAQLPGGSLAQMMIASKMTPETNADIALAMARAQQAQTEATTVAPATAAAQRADAAWRAAQAANLSRVAGSNYGYTGGGGGTGGAARPPAPNTPAVFPRGYNYRYPQAPASGGGGTLVPGGWGQYVPSYTGS